MRADDIPPVCRLYSSVLSAEYISFSELAEGKATSPRELSPDAAPVFRRQLESLLDSPQHCFLVAEAREGLLGFGIASLEKAEAGHLVCWLDDVGVRADCQRHGVGAAIARHILKWGLEEGAQYFLLESGVHNHSAHDAIHAVGFRPLATVFWMSRENARES